MTTSNSESNQKEWKIASLYQFVKLKNVANKQKDLQIVCERNSIFGTLILAEEGINGTITGSPDSIDVIISEIKKWPEIKTLEVKYASSTISNFRRLKIKRKNEIVTMGQDNVDPEAITVEYVAPKDWNDFGVDFVGGCCGINVEHIKELAKIIK